MDAQTSIDVERTLHDYRPARIERQQKSGTYPPHRGRHGNGSAVVDLILSIAKREVTFFNGMAAMSCL